MCVATHTDLPIRGVHVQPASRSWRSASAESQTRDAEQMPIPNTPADQRETAVERAWTAAETASEELNLGHYDRAAGAAAVAAAWAEIASAVRPI